MTVRTRTTTSFIDTTTNLVNGCIPGREGGVILTTMMTKASRMTTKTRNSKISTAGEEPDNNGDNYNGHNGDDGKYKDDDLNF